MAQAWSVRFMVGQGTNRRETYTVPTGKRAVITFVNALVLGATASSAFLFVHGINVLYWPLPGSSRELAVAVRFVAYEHETIQIAIAGPLVGYGCAGYLLEDTGGRPTDADNVISPLAVTRPGVLPTFDGDELG